MATVLNDCQDKALNILNGSDNVFLTGVAGSGKSFLIREFLKEKDLKTFPLLASTGAAAILIGGRTFHSFFGLGIMQGGFTATVERALANKRLIKRLKEIKGVIIDEISMLSGETLKAAETITRKARKKDLPWGGVQIIVVGDFSQLPPVNRFGESRDWAFLSHTWEQSQFTPAVLKTVVRSSDSHFIDVLNDVREGRVSDRVKSFLESRTTEDLGESFDGTRLFARRETTEKFNLTELEKVFGDVFISNTVYIGNEKSIEDLKRNAPVPEGIVLKKGALVMLRQNDPQGRWFNGSLGHIETTSPQRIRVRLFDGGFADIEKTTFSLLDAEGREVASATNFPLNLAYASTIHKAQGMTLDRVQVDLKNLWEPGQAYVALSRVRKGDGLFVSSWTASSIKSDPSVREFHERIFKE